MKIGFGTHFFEWEGNLYRQVSGGPIGLRVSGVVGQILMDQWVKKIHQKAMRSRELNSLDPTRYKILSIEALWKYVDDCVCVLNQMRIGTRFKEDKLIWSKEWEDEDLENGVTPRANTLK